MRAILFTPHMWWYARNEKVEVLLRHQGREGLPFGHMLLLYLDPFALFKDATHGPDTEQRQALSYNRAMRWMLLRYIRRWAAIAAASLFGAAVAETLAAGWWLLDIPALVLGTCCCVALAVIILAAGTWIMLGLRD
jgi:hypothetical protein